MSHDTVTGIFTQLAILCLELITCSVEDIKHIISKLDLEAHDQV